MTATPTTTKTAADALAQIDSALAAHEAGGVFADAAIPDAMRWTADPEAAPTDGDPFADADIIHAYSRAQALADGELVDAGEMAREAGFQFPVALTRAAWADCVTWTVADDQRKGTCQDEKGRLWDVLWMTKVAIRRAAQSTDRIRVRLVRVPRTGRGVLPRPVELVAVCGPGDNAEPVITIMQPHED